MKLTASLNFALTVELQTIIGFIIYPVKEQVDVEDTRIPLIAKCSPEEAEAWAIYAIVDNEGIEWMADLSSQEAANQFAELLKCLYNCGKHEARKPNPNEIAIKWTVTDIMGRAKQLDLRINTEEAQILLEDLVNNHDCNMGITWETIDMYLYQLERAWINRDVLEKEKGTQVGVLTCNYPGGMPYMWANENQTLLIWHENEWRQAIPNDFVFTNPTPQTGLSFHHDEFASDIQTEEGEELNYRIEQTSNSPENFELTLYKHGEQYMNSYHYEASKEAEEDIRLACGRYNIKLTDIGTDE